MQRKQRTSNIISPNLRLLRSMIRNYMNSNSIKQYEVGELIGYSSAVISRWFKNDNIEPQENTLIKVANTLNYDISKDDSGNWSLVDPQSIVNEKAGTYSIKSTHSAIDKLLLIAEKTTDKQTASEIKEVITKLSIERARIYQELADVRAMALHLREKYEGQ